MKFITVSGPPSSGKTAVILRTIEQLPRGTHVGVVKFDCLTTADKELYERHGVPVKVGIAGSLCPDHFFIINIEATLKWGVSQGFDVLISESAGLCNRCSPHIRNVTVAHEGYEKSARCHCYGSRAGVCMRQRDECCRHVCWRVPERPKRKCRKLWLRRRLHGMHRRRLWLR